MLIERIQVEEGFLDGLDLTFHAGLNVLIGPRGSGKTSVIELLRYCLGATAYSDRIKVRAQQHLHHVLQTGAVTVTCRLGAHRVHVKRSAQDEISVSNEPVPSPIILSQGEIETIGIDTRGRLRLLDSLRPETHSEGSDSSVLASIRSIGIEIRDALRQLQALTDEVASIESTAKQLSALQNQQSTLLQGAQGTKEQQAELDTTSKGIAKHARRLDSISQVTETLLNLGEDLEASITTVEDVLEVIPATDRSMQPVRKLVIEGLRDLQGGTKAFHAALAACESLKEEDTKEKRTLDDKARGLRQQLERAQEGAGKLAQQIAALQERDRRHQQLQATAKRKMAALEQLRKKRNGLLSVLENSRRARFESRKAIASNLSRELAPAIQVSVEHLAEHAQYESAIVAILKGSGLHYNTIAPELAKTLTPGELAVAIENNMPDVIADSLGIDIFRASKIIAHARHVGTEDLLAADLEDEATFTLLVGNERRASEKLSVGQRCTAVLPILLAAHEQVLVIDQPEDNLDNAFVVNTVIRAIRKRPPETGQLICATHNPNIPVLGEARHVVLLESDGRQGFVSSAAGLDDPRTVQAITTIMEGGREAFQQRAQFYGSIE